MPQEAYLPKKVPGLEKLHLGLDEVKKKMIVMNNREPTINR